MESINPTHPGSFDKRGVQSIVRQGFVRYVIMFATDENERNPVIVCKLFARKRPEEVNQDAATWS